MGQYFEIHRDNPQGRLVQQAVEVIRKGGVAIYPTDSCYALGCLPGEKNALDRIIRIRQLDERHNMTLVCNDLSQISTLARVGNTEFRLIKSLTPGPYTFLLRATREVPRRLQHPKRRTIGIRVPDNKIVDALLEALGGPMLSTSLVLPGDDLPLNDPEEFRERLQREVDVIIDGGPGGLSATTVLDLTGDEPQLVREGLGKLDHIVEIP